MAKKKIKKEKDEVKTIDWPEAHNQLVDKIEALEQRIDRIVNALDKSKKVKGL